MLQAPVQRCELSLTLWATDVASVSVIVPTYNRLGFLRQALDSIRSQAMANLEIIVVDDGSNDGTFEAISACHDLTVIRQDNGGPSAARNAGLRAATAPILSFLDSDDLWPDRALATLVGALRRADDAVMGKVQPIGEDGCPNGELRVGAYLGSGVYRREIYESIGGFDENRRSWEDLDWLNKAREHGFSIRTLDEPTLLYRTHDDNMSADLEESKTGLLDAIHESLQRRRRDQSND